MVETGRVYRYRNGMRVRVVRTYVIAGEVRMHDGATHQKGTPFAVVSVVGNPKLRNAVPCDSLTAE